MANGDFHHAGWSEKNNDHFGITAVYTIKHEFTCFLRIKEQIAEDGNRWNGWHVVNSQGV